jgi:hypothetical protein
MVIASDTMATIFRILAQAVNGNASPGLNAAAVE